MRWTMMDLLFVGVGWTDLATHPEPDRGWGILYAVGISQAVQRRAPPYIRR